MPDTLAISTDTDGTGPPTATGGPESAGLISVAQLVAHPGNVREDLDLTAEFCASVAGSGVRIPLLVTRDGDDGSFRVRGTPAAGRRCQGGAGRGAVRAGRHAGR